MGESLRRIDGTHYAGTLGGYAVEVRHLGDGWTLFIANPVAGYTLIARTVASPAEGAKWARQWVDRHPLTTPR